MRALLDGFAMRLEFSPPTLEPARVEAKCSIPFNSNNAKQQEFLAACRDPAITSIAYIGGRGSGKTFALCRVFIEAADRYKGIRLALTAESYPKLRDSTKKAFTDMLRAGRVPHTHNRRDEIISFDNGSEVYFRSHDDPDRLRGPEFAFIGIDEARNTREEAYLVSVGSLRQPGFPHKLIIATTPRGPRHWTARYFIHPATRLPGSAAILASSHDNRANLPAGYLERLEAAYSGAFARQEIYGDLTELEGRVYDAFDPGRNVIQEEATTEVTEGKGEISPLVPWGLGGESSPIYCGLDFGARHPVAAVWLAFQPDGSAVIIDEYKRAGLTAHEHARAILAREHKVCAWFCDPSGAQWRIELAECGLFAAPARRITGPLAHWKPAMHAKINSLFASGRLKVAAHCTQLIDELLMLTWKDSENGEASEETTKINDDLIDALHYVLASVPVPPVPLPTKPEPEIHPFWKEIERLRAGYERSIFDML